ncbi:hypothetical protein [Sphingomonas molluscorum]|uniref:hypothetical protein n=1 Tax=Sphingomonas molluscorum TaxID=418184 RepID=UPI0031D8AAA5
MQAHEQNCCLRKEEHAEVAQQALKVAVIGSFRQHYDAVLSAIETFRAAGWSVTSPDGSSVLDPAVEFVRFDTDEPDWTDAEIQSITLERIFSADLTYVIAPSGYVGRTTCYEIGRLIQSGRPIYFSEKPEDLPIRVPDRFVATPEQLVGNSGARMTLESIHAMDDDLSSRTERGLIR